MIILHRRMANDLIQRAAMTVADVAITVVFGTWLVVTAVCQFTGPLARYLRRFDVLRLIPQWTFFAPRPATHDYWFLYRDQLPGGSMTRWHEIPCKHSHPLIAPVWNPPRRHNKALFDISSQLGLLARDMAPNLAPLKITVPYLTLLNYISSLPRNYYAVATQFLIMTSGDRAAGTRPSPLLVSALHELE
jgi:hypothetical protein